MEKNNSNKQMASNFDGQRLLFAVCARSFEKSVSMAGTLGKDKSVHQFLSFLQSAFLFLLLLLPEKEISVDAKLKRNATFGSTLGV